MGASPKSSKGNSCQTARGTLPCPVCNMESLREDLQAEGLSDRRQEWGLWTTVGRDYEGIVGIETNL